MGKRPRSKPAALTLDALDGAASKRVAFLRTDATAVATPSPVASKSRLKEAFASSLEPQWVAVSGVLTADILRELGAEATARSAQGPRRGVAPLGIYIGRNAVSRRLRKRALRSLVVARDAGLPMLYAHLPLLAQQAGVTPTLLSCSSAQLGQLFGLPRISAIGLDAQEFPDDHALVLLLRRAAGEGLPFPWLPQRRDGPPVNEPCVPSGAGLEPAAQPAAPAAHGEHEHPDAADAPDSPRLQENAHDAQCGW